MADIEATKFYIRYQGEYPETSAQGWAEYGFRQFGVETIPFYGFGDIEMLTDLGPTVGVAGFIGDVHAALKTLGKPPPPNIDYPPELAAFLGREIREGTLEDVRRHPGKPMFIKPKEHKLFTGFVWDGDALSRRRIVTLGDDTPVFLCEPVEFVAEYRSFVFRGEVLDARRYKGDWSKAPDKETVLRGAKALGGTPSAYCLDWGVTSDGRTLLVEKNEGYSFGHYGILPTDYARMLSARWLEMTSSASPASHDVHPPSSP